jgi:hypothetical protein
LLDNFSQSGPELASGHDWRNDCQSTTAIYHKYSKLDRSNTGENIDAKLAQVCRLPDVASARGAAHGKQLTQSA